jgi:hypothetical protein
MSKRYHDKCRHVRKSRITVGDRVLMKNRCTDPLSPIPGRVIEIRGNAVTARFDSSHSSIQFLCIVLQFQGTKSFPEEASMCGSPLNAQSCVLSPQIYFNCSMVELLYLYIEQIWFPGIARLCKETVRNCESCQATHDRTYDEPLQSWHTISV